MVPNGWEKSDLTHLITIKHGFAFKSEFYSDKGQYVLLTPGSFYETGGFRDQGSKTKYYIGDIPDGYILSQGDMLLAMTEQAEGLLGSALFVPENNRYLHNQRLGLVQILNQEKVCKDFLYLFFNSPSIRKQITEQSTGTKVKHTSPDRLCSVIGLIPPLKEQQKIAEIISSWDQAISATEKLLENSQQQKKALMQQLLTGKKRLLDETGVSFSEKWKTYKLKEICHLGAGVSAPQDEKYFLDGQYDFLRVSDLGSSNSRFAPPSRDKLNSTAIAELRMSPVSAGATLFTKSGASLLLNQRAQLQADTYIVSHIGFAKAIENFSSDDYLYYLFCNIDFKNLAAGTSLPALQLSVLSGYQLKIPSVAEQEKISEVLSVADKEIEILQKKLDCLKQEKKALMQQLLTGKKRVKGAA